MTDSVEIDKLVSADSSKWTDSKKGREKESEPREEVEKTIRLKGFPKERSLNDVLMYSLSPIAADKQEWLLVSHHIRLLRIFVLNHLLDFNTESSRQLDLKYLPVTPAELSTQLVE